MIFNVVSSRLYSLPVLNEEYPKDLGLTVISGNSVDAVFSVEMEEHGKPDEYSYQWYDSNGEITGATGSTYTRAVSEDLDTEIYCKVTNKAGTVETRKAKLKVEKHYVPVLTAAYPADKVAYYTSNKSASATFLVEIAEQGNPDEYSYQWYMDENPVGANAPSYTVSDLSTEQEHDIYCIVSNAAGSVKSRVAKLKASLKYLYRNGDQCVDLTGGWTAKNSGQSVGGTWYPTYYGAAELQADRMRMTAKIKDCYGGRCVTNKKVDLTGHSKLKFSHATYGRSTYAVSTDQSETGIVKREYVPLKYSSSGTLELDVSGLSGEYYVICFGGACESQSAGEYAEVFDVWLD